MAMTWIGCGEKRQRAETIKICDDKIKIKNRGGMKLRFALSDGVVVRDVLNLPFPSLLFPFFSFPSLSFPSLPFPSHSLPTVPFPFLPYHTSAYPTLLHTQHFPSFSSIPLPIRSFHSSVFFNISSFFLV